MKKVLLFSLLLLIVSGGLLTIQWIGYEKISKASETIISAQEIELDVKKDHLIVNQTIRLLPENEKMNFKLPADADQVSCSKGDVCEIGGQAGTVDINGESLTIHYQLPAPNIDASFTLNNWYASFSDVNISATTVMIIDHTKQGGEWVSSLEQTAAKQMSLIDFYSFQGNSGQAPLYWQKSPLVKSVLSPKITVYNVESVQSTTFSFVLPFDEDEIAPQTVVIAPNVKPVELSGLTLVQNLDGLKTIRNQVIHNYALQHFIFQESEKWLASFIAVSLYDSQPVFPKAAVMKEKITAQLTKTEQTEWLKELMDLKGKEVSAQKLDDLLGSIKGEETQFFTNNKESDAVVQPLIFFDSRPVIIEGKEAAFHLVKKEGVLYVPLKEAAESLGFTIQELSAGQEWLMKKKFETYRFYLNENRVLFNEHTYVLYDTAIQNINGTMHVDKIWFQKIFLIEVQEKLEEINLQPYEL
ncbi:stalk domain-containing protein [Domibacillus mangrovi]|uniref:Copper amine oxidase-like N-terminal domain-containing protein n=1 Tax=Domibacillus mangrovi TaxID=1714354 RepID=A0A1Q5P4Y8_9BACI|nr:stalk domain-containing protein [Domibacillus mangrovi]OKL37231.1 hypothetical protein BLL40_06545 [Domibacillus mangrovi]